MKLSSYIFLAVSMFFFNAEMNAQEEWALKKDKNGIKIYAKKIPGLKYDEIKVETVFDGKISHLAAVLFDVNRQRDWVYKTTKSELLKEISATDVIYYTEIEVPWPFDNRDLVSYMTLKQNPQTKVVTIEARNLNDFMPAKKDIVRIKYSSTTWNIIPINEHQFRVDYRLRIDPGDGVPAWLLNLFSTTGPYESFLKLKTKMKMPQYAQAKFPSVID